MKRLGLVALVVAFLAWGVGSAAAQSLHVGGFGIGGLGIGGPIAPLGLGSGLGQAPAPPPVGGAGLGSGPDALGSLGPGTAAGPQVSWPATSSSAGTGLGPFHVPVGGTGGQ